MTVSTIIIIAVVAVCLVVLGILALRFSSFNNWLIYAVSEAEKCLGAGTGKLKIRYAYDLALKKFPTLSKLIPWSLFSWLIDKALIIMRDMISNNADIAIFIEK